jgi:S1-C subfamily serine protease
MSIRQFLFLGLFSTPLWAREPLPPGAADLAAGTPPAAAPIAPPLPAEPLETGGSGLYQSVLRIETSSQTYNYRTPWGAGNFIGGTGTGFLVGENLILTNAHVVSNARRLILKKHGSAGAYPAKLLHIAHDCDLALLALEDPAPLAGVAKLEIGGMPDLESTVRVIGYPVGGERLSVTRGVVSRIDFNTYSHSGVDQHLVVQIDAAINPGNSGGPVLQGDKVVGVAFQGLRAADNTGYMIPTPVIKRFLEDIADGRYDHYVDLAFSDFQLINPAQRRALGLPDDDRGILITHVSPDGSADGKVQAGDILLALDGYPVYSNGQIEIDGQMVNMHEAVERKFSGDKAVLSFLREGREQEAEIILRQFEPARLFATEYETRPSFAVFGGLVFQPVTRNLIGAYGLDSLEIRNFLTEYTEKARYREWREIIILTQVLPDEINADMAGLGGLIVDSINGQPVRALADLQNLLFEPLAKDGLPEFIVIKCIGTDRPLILEGSRLREAQDRIRGKYGIQNDHFFGRVGENSGW